MTPLSQAHAELRLFVTHVERKAIALGERPYSALRQQDHLTESASALCDALDRVEQGLGARLQLALFAHVHAMSGAITDGEGSEP